MNKASIPVLELLNEAGIAIPGQTIALNLDRMLSHAPSRATVYRTLDPLEAHGLIEHVTGDTKHYIITEKGEQFLAGDLRASEL
ncbi:helix-turn-helix transcriptional regulator [Halogranum amylolyticum]